MVTSFENLLGGLSAEEFLDEYWQKRPLLVRNAVDVSQLKIDGSQLAELSERVDVESRIVIGPEQADNWQVSFGPFDPRELSRLPTSHWTLLVQAVDRYFPGLRSLKSQFSFVPNWRFDDVMASFASNEGGVGPHLDNYDVFLIQARGQRRWQIEETQRRDDHFIENLDLKVLAEFNPQQDWILEPGDMLYLPPMIPHNGVAQGECVTLSVGFRAPSLGDLFAARAESLVQSLPETTRYSDPDLKPTAQPGEIDRSSIKRVILMMNEVLKSSSEPASWFGRLVTQPLREPVDKESCALSQAKSVGVNPGARIAYYRERDGIRFFHNGEENWVPLSLLSFCEELSVSENVVLEESNFRVEGFKQLLRDAQDSGAIHLMN